jgi:hypothetical protein
VSRQTFTHPGLRCPLCTCAKFGIIAGKCAECRCCGGQFRLDETGRLSMVAESVTTVVTRMNEGRFTLTPDGRKMAVEAATQLRGAEDAARFGNRFVG